MATLEYKNHNGESRLVHYDSTKIAVGVARWLKSRNWATDILVNGKPYGGNNANKHKETNTRSRH